jgi:opacity protein-like surface antigen
LEWFGTLHGRVGFVADRWVVYGTGGLAYGRLTDNELLYRERQFPFEPKDFCEWGAKPQIKEFRN